MTGQKWVKILNHTSEFCFGKRSIYFPYVWGFPEIYFFNLSCMEYSSYTCMVSWGTTGWLWASSVPWLPRKLMGSWDALEGVWPAGRRTFSFPSTLPWWGPIWSIVSSSGLPTSRKMRSYWRESSGGLQGWWGDWNVSPMRRGWGSWACSAWRREGCEGTY